jgi:hypothetical protein
MMRPQRIIDQFNTIFVHIPRCRIIVCKECGTGVVKAHVATHLNSKHAYLTISTRADVVRVVRAMNDLAENEDGVVYPEPGSNPIPHLSSYIAVTSTTGQTRGREGGRPRVRASKPTGCGLRTPEGWGVCLKSVARTGEMIRGAQEGKA